MTLDTFDTLHQANKNGYALGAFNVANIETLKAVTNAANKLQSPVILEASDGEINYFGIKQLASVVKAYQEDINVPLILNLDHGKDFESCKEAIEAGFKYIHFDGGKTPFEENVEITRELVKIAHSKGIPVEGEIDHIEGSSASHLSESPNTLQDEKLYTNPEKAREFVEKTGVDVFAAFIGNLHGIYADEIRLNLKLLSEIEKAIPNTMLSLHGGSGVNDNDIKEAVKHNIVKVNVNSEMRIAFKLTLQESLNSTDEIAIYKITPPAIAAVQSVVEKKIKLFGSAKVL